MFSTHWTRTGRYGAVVILGFAADFTIALTLAWLLGVPLGVSATIGFGIALAINYVLFEFWAFRGELSAFSATRFSQTMLAALVALCVRVSVISVLGSITSTLPEVAAAILVASAASLCVNYLLVNLVFTRL